MYGTGRVQVKSYRAKWIKHFGPISVDENGHPYEIHHIDGNRKNNDLSNMMCVSISEHYKIHLEQGDLAAAALIARRMNIDPAERSRVCSERSKETGRRRVEEGTHNFVGKVSCVDEDGNSYFVSKEEYVSGNHVSNMSAEGKKRTGCTYRTRGASKAFVLLGKQYECIEDYTRDTGVSRYKLLKNEKVIWL